MKLLTKEQKELYENTKICFICNEKFENKYVRHKIYCKVRNNLHNAGEYRGIAYSTYNLKYSVPKTIPIAFYNGSNHDYYFIIKKLAEEF